MKVDFVNIQRQDNKIKEELTKAIYKVINEDYFIFGKTLKVFENNFAEYCNSKYCSGVNSGTSALHLALLALDIKKGDEIITAPNSFISVALSLHYVGAKPVFVDIDPKTYNIDTNKIKEKITDKTKAILAVHSYGNPCNIEELTKIAKDFNLKLIEDCSHALGSLFKGRKVGSFGDLACFSFYPSKNMGAYGNAGAIITKNKNLAEKIRLLRNYGFKEKYKAETPGFNAVLDTIQAAILNVKLKYLDKWNNMRRKNAEKYNELLNNLNIILPQEADESKHVYHLYIIRTKKRDKLKQYLFSKEISTSIHYPIPLHLEKIFAYLKYKKNQYPITERFSKEILSLPMFPELKDEEIEYVAKNIKDGIK